MPTKKKKPAKRKPKPKVKPKTIRVAIVRDWVGGGGQTGEEETENIKKRVERAIKPHVAKYVYVGDKMSSLLTADLLVFDYGGMANAYRANDGSLSAYDYGRIVARWIEDHPSSLVVIASTFSYDVLIKRELEELGVILDKNLWVDNEDGSQSFAQRTPEQRREDERHPGPPNLLVGYMAFRVWPRERLTDMEQAIHDWFFPS